MDVKYYPLIKRKLIHPNSNYIFSYWISYHTKIAELDLVISESYWGAADYYCRASNVYVEEAYRRLGVATKLYDAADLFLLHKNLPRMVPSLSLNEFSRAFWDDRLKNYEKRRSNIQSK